MQRDFTYIDDIIEGIVRLMPKAPSVQRPDTSNAVAPFNIYNIGNNNPVALSRFIKAIEAATGIEAMRNNLPMQPGDVPGTYADVDDLMADIGFKPDTSIEEGIESLCIGTVNISLLPMTYARCREQNYSHYSFGGAGWRLWPVSRQMHPKPFMEVAGKPLLAHAMERAALIADGR